VNAFFRWHVVSDLPDTVEMELFLTKPSDLKTTFTIPTEATADVTVRRLQKLHVKPGQQIEWAFSLSSGTVPADSTGCVTIPTRKITTSPTRLVIRSVK